MNFVCNDCNYNTNDKSHYNRHLKSKKHLKNVLNDTNNNIEIQPPPIALLGYICEFCNGEFSRSDNLNRHQKFCIKKKTVEKAQQKSEQINFLTMKLSNSEKESKHYKQETEYYKFLLTEAGGMVKNSISTLSCLVKNYNDAPAIKMITIADVPKLEKNKKKLAEEVISAFRHKTLDRYFGDLIIGVYKKSDPKEQSIWNTDSSRYTYLIKEPVKNKLSNWMVDKEGVNTKKYIINPLIVHTRKSLVIYLEKNCKVTETTSTFMCRVMLENSKTISAMLNDIDDGFIAKGVLKYITPHFKFNQKLFNQKQIVG